MSLRHAYDVGTPIVSIVTKALIRPGGCPVGKSSAQLRQRLRFHHNDADSKMLLLSRDEVSDSATMMRSQKAFYSVATTSPI